ncbi:cyclase family protein [Flectobacillus longus]|uniref:cyclase family protein n=1 Tax=Flectobacillus longus TaxID=2984207 RepID=UPI0024B749AC|nr:cyclase family protein [Flectobacillus longus]MDI9880059.1 cyclase family protein [Flectobacillus longus]
MNIIDISVPLSNNLPTWPGGYGLHISSLQKIEDGSEANVSRLDLDVHSGTHIDAPLHFVADGKTTNDIPLQTLCGEAQIIKIEDSWSVITAELLDQLSIHKGIKRLLFKTANSTNQLWTKKEFDISYVALSACAAQWVVDHQIQLVGIDYCSIQKFFDPVDTHQILLKNAVIILEGLDLLHVEEGIYQLICLPLKVEGIEGVPVRAILTI